MPWTSLFAQQVGRCAIATLSTLWLTLPVQAIPFYSLTDLGDWEQFDAFRLNNNGQIAGSGWEGVSLWQNGTLTPLGDVHTGLSRIDINDQGQIIAGSSLWQQGHWTPLGLPEQQIAVQSLNQQRQIVGSYLANPEYISPPPYSQAFLWDNGFTPLADPHSEGLAINNIGQVAGTAYSSEGQQYGFFWDGQKMQPIGSDVDIFALNDQGQIVGLSLQSGIERAFLWHNGQLYDLGTLGGSISWAYSINNRGQIVGGSTNSEGENRAFLWEDGTLYDLNQYLVNGEDWKLVWSTDINEQGQIVGVAQFKGMLRSVLLTPISENSPHP